MLQPLVENAIRHGAHARPGPALVELSTRRDGGRLVVEIADDGPGVPSPPKSGHGLRNTVARLASLYGAAAELVLTARPGGGTIARLVLPARRANDAPGEQTQP
jgi:sensor histidine kinase YesM